MQTNLLRLNISGLGGKEFLKSSGFMQNLSQLPTILFTEQLSAEGSGVVRLLEGHSLTQVVLLK
jgi:hypothetical protein